MIARSLIAAVLCLVLAGHGSWLAFDGLRTGETKWRRIVGTDAVTYVRKQHPLKFSATIAAFLMWAALFSIGAALLAVRVYYLG